MCRRKVIFIILIFIILIVFTGCNSKDYENDNKDSEEILKIALDYIEGWYEGDAERMGRALHPNMIKRHFENGKLNELDTKRMVSSTNRGGGEDVPKDTYKIEVEILEKHNTIASVVTRSQYIEYLHLAKVNGRWVIVNVLWDVNRD